MKIFKKKTLSNRRSSSNLKHPPLNSDKSSLSATASLLNASAAPFLVAQSTLPSASTRQGTKFLNAPRLDAPPASTTLPMSASSAGLALNTLLLRSFSNLGSSLASLAGSGSAAPSTAEARQSAAAACELGSCSVKSASASGFRKEENGCRVTRADSAPTESAQAARTEESGSRRRRTRLARILERKGESASPCAWESVATMCTHCLRTGVLSEASVE